MGIYPFVVSREEANEETKLEVIAAMGAWLCHADSVSKATLQRLIDGLKEKDALKRAHLKSLNKVNSIL